MSEHADLNLKNVGEVIRQVKNPILLGWQLELADSKIRELDNDHKGDHCRLAYGIAGAWLDPKSNLSPNWKKLEEALRKDSVDESVLAAKVKEYYTPRRESEASNNDSVLTSSMSSCSMPSPFSPTSFEFSRSGSVGKCWYSYSKQYALCCENLT